MEGGASVHREGLTQQCRDFFRIPSAIWPLSFPDLSSIKAFWDLLKSRFNRRSPRPKRMVEMKVAIFEGWGRVGEEEILTFVISMSECIGVVIAAEGDIPAGSRTY